jgi:hypothetical protein
MISEFLNYSSDLLDKNSIHGLDSIYSITYFLFLKNNFFNESDINDLISKMNDNSNNELIKQTFEKINTSFEKKYNLDKYNFNIEIFSKMNDIINTMDYKKFKYDNIIFDTMEYFLKWENLVWVKEYMKYHRNPILTEWIYNLGKPNISGGQINENILDANLKIDSYFDSIVKHINNEKKPNQPINWNNNKNKIFGIQTNPIVRALNIMKLKQLTNENFTKNIMSDNVIISDFTTGPKNYDLIYCDLPIGLHNMIHANCCKKVKDLKLRGTKAEPLFLQLFMQSLNKNGRCVVMVPDSFLFSDSQQPIETRKYLIENFNIKKIIQIDENLFLGKNNRCSIIYFENAGKTTNIKFSKIKLNNEKIEELNILDLSSDKVKLNMFSLYYKNYESIDKSERIAYDKVSKFFIIDNKPLENNPDALILVLNKYYKSENSIQLVKSSDFTNHIDGNIYIWFKSPENNIFETQYLEFIIKNHYEYTVKGKMNQFDKDKILDLEVPILEPKIQIALKNYMLVTKNLIKAQIEEIKMYMELKKFLMDTIPSNQLVELVQLVEIFDSESIPEVSDNDYIIGVIKNSLSAGMVYLKRPNDDFSTNSHYIRIKDSRIKPNYLFHYLKHMESKIVELANLTAQPNLTKPVLAGIMVKLISMDEQNEVVTQAGDIDMSIQMKELANKKLKETDIITTVINLQKMH